MPAGQFHNPILSALRKMVAMRGNRNFGGHTHTPENRRKMSEAKVRSVPAQPRGDRGRFSKPERGAR
jgi:hypothetical protein